MSSTFSLHHKLFSDFLYIFYGRKTAPVFRNAIKIVFSLVGRAAISPPQIVTMLILRRLEGKPPYRGIFNLNSIAGFPRLSDL